MDVRERYEDQEETVRIAQDAMRASLWTALPGIVQSFKAARRTAVVQPALAQLRIRSGENVPLAVLQDVPVLFPGGGGFSLTFPVAAGDECLLVFCCRALDAWYASGGVQPAPFARMHDLSDAVAIVGLRSQSRLSGGSASTAQLRSDDGATYVEVRSGGVVRIVAPGGLEVQGDIRATGDVSAGTISLQGHVHQGVQPGGGQSGAPVP